MGTKQWRRRVYIHRDEEGKIDALSCPSGIYYIQDTPKEVGEYKERVFNRVMGDYRYGFDKNGRIVYITKVGE